MAIGNLKAENYLPVIRNNQGYYTAYDITTTGRVTAANATFTNTPTGSMFVVSYEGQTTEAATDRVLFVAPFACQITAAVCGFAVAAGGASTLQLTKDTGTTAPGAGTDLLTNNTNAGFDLNATANTPQTGTFTATTATLQFAAGDRLSMDFANTIQSTAGLYITCTFKTI